MNAISDVNRALRESTKPDDNYVTQAINAENSEKIKDEDGKQAASLLEVKRLLILVEI